MNKICLAFVLLLLGLSMVSGDKVYDTKKEEYELMDESGCCILDFEYIKVDVEEYSFTDYEKFINKNRFALEFRSQHEEWPPILIPHMWTSYYQKCQYDYNYLPYVGCELEDVIGHKIVLHERPIITSEEVCECAGCRPVTRNTYLIWEESLVYSESKGVCLEVWEGQDKQYYKIHTIYIKPNKDVYLPGLQEPQIPKITEVEGNSSDTNESDIKTGLAGKYELRWDTEPMDSEEIIKEIDRGISIAKFFQILLGICAVALIYLYIKEAKKNE